MKVIGNQSLFDIAIQETGSIDTAFEYAVKNGISITDDLEVNKDILIPESEFRNQDMLRYFKDKKKKIATSMTAENHDLIIAEDGIGFMIIEDTFIVR